MPQIKKPTAAPPRVSETTNRTPATAPARTETPAAQTPRSTAATTRNADDFGTRARARPPDTLATAAVTPPLQLDAGTPTLSVAQIRGLEASEGRRLTVSELAQRFPNARIGTEGLTLSELARRPLGTNGPDGAPLTLGAATIDKNGDLDVTPLVREELTRHNQNLLIRKGDEPPVELSDIIRNSVFIIRHPAHAERLGCQNLPTIGGKVAIDLSNAEQVETALRATGFDVDDDAAMERELQRAGVTTPLDRSERLQRILLQRLDHPDNLLDIDDALVKQPGRHNHQFQPTVYASAKVSPSDPDHVVLSYKRFNNQSFAGQGWWTATVLGKRNAVQHEFDSEAMFVKLGIPGREVETILAARHYYAERYDADEIAAVKARTGRDDLTTSIAYKSHGTRLAEPTRENVWAGHGEDGVQRGDLRDYVLKDNFMGLEDVARGNAILIPKEQVQLIFESDDRQSLDLRLQFGATRAGVLGTRLLDVFNDGTPVDRFGGTRWYYEQEAMDNR